MYNLLIVDDELHVVKGLLVDLDKEKLAISEVYTAYNIRQAKEVLKQHPVHIMLCDIEMPQGTGLELLEWANGHCNALQTIFLTSHQDFRYAKQAIQLGGLDYLLKPVTDEELEEAIGKAKARLGFTHNAHKLERLWNANHPSIIEHFWTELLQQKIASTPKAIERAWEERNIPFTSAMSFLPILIRVNRWHKPLSVREEKIMEYALKNSGLEMIVGAELNGQMITADHGSLLLIMTLDKTQETETMFEALMARCKAYVQSCHHYFYCDLACYIGNVAEAEEIVAAYAQLRKFEGNNVAFQNTVFLLTGSSPPLETQATLPDMRVWAALLKSGLKEQVVEEIHRFLEERLARGELTALMLRQFHQDFLQILYFVLMAKGRMAHELFSDSESMALSRNAVRSVDDLLRWVAHTVHKALAQEMAGHQPNEVVKNVKQYIAANLDDSDLSREEIARHAFLNPDYLARIFKKETGVPLMEYLQQERIGLAKDLLLRSDSSIGEIAASVGFSHFSHFSKMFKKLTGMNPNEFRQHNRV